MQDDCIYCIYNEFACPPRGSGGTGRRARLRILWPKGRGGSTPSFRTKPCFAPDTFNSVDLRFGDRCSAFEKIKVASFVGLRYVLQKQFAVAARIDAVFRPPRSSAEGQFLVAHAHIQLARVDVQFDDVTVLQQRERSANK